MNDLELGQLADARDDPLTIKVTSGLLFDAVAAALDPGAPEVTRLLVLGRPVAAVVPWEQPADGMVEAVMDVLAPWADGIPGVCQPVRYPLIRFDHDGMMVMPSDGQVRMLAEQIVTALRAGGPA